MIQDKELAKSVARILQRSERQADLSKLIASYVDVGVLPQLENRNHQIILGRRGTGKTHILKVVQSNFQKDDRNIVVYIDARTLGSTSQFSDTTLPVAKRCYLLFQDLLGPIHNAFYEWVLEYAPKNAINLLNEADRLLELIAGVQTTAREDKREIAVEFQARSDLAASGVLAPSEARFELGSKRESSSATKQISQVSIVHEDKIVFPALHDILRRLLVSASAELIVLIDEWSSLPLDIQPYLAEFIKRGILPVTNATVKIAALEHRSRFVNNDAPSRPGMELGADIATGLDLDDYYVIDRNPEALTTAYAEMLLKHLQIDMPGDYLAVTHGVKNGDNLASRMFTERATFRELARASEGVARDLINIFILAFFGAQRRGRDTIDRQAVVDAARRWFEQDKSSHLDDAMVETLQRIVSEVIGHRRARSFLLPRELQRNPMILSLFDARVLHQMQRGYADKDNPGVRYNIYTLDYGTYVDLIGTSRQPELDLQSAEVVTPDIVVPYDDKRSIRRIVLTADILVPSRTSPEQCG